MNEPTRMTDPSKKLHILLIFTKGGTSKDAGDKYGMSAIEAVENAKEALDMVCKIGGIAEVPNLREVYGTMKWQDIVQLTIERINTPVRTTDRRKSKGDRRKSL